MQRARAIRGDAIGSGAEVENCVCGAAPKVEWQGANACIRCSRCGVNSGTVGALDDVLDVWNQMMTWGRHARG